MPMSKRAEKDKRAWLRIKADPERLSLSRRRVAESTAAYYARMKMDAVKYAGYLEHRRAKNAVQRAVKSGHVIRPSTCSRCSIECKPEGHHHDYGKPLDVVWVCRPCHRAIERGEP